MVEGRFKKWKCLHSCMSYRGRVLIINNLIASALWHKLSVLEPPVDLLIKVQIMLVDFFGGIKCTGYHRVFYIYQNNLEVKA